MEVLALGCNGRPCTCPIMASVKAAAALAAVSGGTLYNAVVKDSVITGSQALEWSRRAVAALDEYERPNARK